MGLLACETLDKKIFIGGTTDSIFPDNENWVGRQSRVLTF